MPPHFWHATLSFIHLKSTCLWSVQMEVASMVLLNDKIPKRDVKLRIFSVEIFGLVIQLWSNWSSSSGPQRLSVMKTLERYQRCCFNPQDNNNERETQSWYQEVSKLKAKFESLQRTQRHLLGEDLGPLSVKELHNLEKQLEGALTQARQRKTQIMVEQMEELRRKERELGDMNKHLKIKVSHELSTFETDGQGYRAQLQCPWNSGLSPTNNNNNNTTFQMHPASQSNPMDCQQEQPILQIGYNQFMHGGEGPSIQRNMVGETSIHGWVL